MGLSITGEVFVGRKEEIRQFLEFLKKRDCPAFVLVGEPGIGKTSFMREVARRLVEDEKIVVGLYEVPFSAGVANPFVGALGELVSDLAAENKEQVRGVFKRFAKTCRNVALKKGDRIARAFVKDLVTKLAGKHVVRELEELKKEFDKTSTVYSLAREFVREHRSEFIYDFQEFLGQLMKEFKGRDLVLLIDQFERAPMPSCEVLLDLAGRRLENVRVAVALKVEEKGSKRFDYIEPHLKQMGAKILELGPLQTEEIGEWMRSLKKDFSYPELNKIKRLSRGIPFVISEWLKTSKEYDLHELEVAGGTYCEFVKWRLDSLDNEDRLMLRRLSVLLQPLSLRDYEKLAGIETGRCHIFFNELTSKWIFDKYGDTFWFRNDLIRVCVEQTLTKLGKRESHENAAVFFQRKFDEFHKTDEKIDFDVGLGCAYHWHLAGNHAESLRHNMQLASFCFKIGSLDLAEDCYLRAMESAESLGREDSKMLAVGNLANVYYVWGRTDEAFKTHVEVLEHSRKKGDRTNEALALHQLGIVEQDRGSYDEAVRLHNESLDLFRRLGDQSGISAALHQLAMVHQNRGDYDEAVRLYNESLVISQKLGDKSGEARAIHNLAMVHQDRGDYDEAVKLYQQSLGIKRRLGDQRGIGKTLHNLAIVYQRRGDYDKAVRLYNESLVISQKLGDKSGIAKTLHHLGIVEQDRGSYDEAVRSYEQSLEIVRELGDQSGISAALHQLAMVHQDRGDYDEAVKLYQQSLGIKRRLGDQRGIGKTLHNLAIVYQRRGDYDKAVRLYNESLVISQKLGDKSGIAKTLHHLGIVEQDRGSYDEAVRLYNESLDLFRRLGDKSNTAEILHNLAIVYQRRGDYDKAVRLYNESLDLFRRLGDQSGISAALHQLAMVHQDRGDYDEAVKLYQQSLGIKRRLGDQRGIGLSYGQLGILYESLDKPIIAADYYIRALNIFQKIGDTPNAIKAQVEYERITKQRKADSKITISE